MALKSSIAAASFAILVALWYKHAWLFASYDAESVDGNHFDPVSVVTLLRGEGEPDVIYMRSGNAIMGGRWIDDDIADEPIFLNFAIQQVCCMLFVLDALLNVERRKLYSLAARHSTRMMSSKSMRCSGAALLKAMALIRMRLPHVLSTTV